MSSGSAGAAHRLIARTKGRLMHRSFAYALDRLLGWAPAGPRLFRQILNRTGFLHFYGFEIAEIVAHLLQAHMLPTRSIVCRYVVEAFAGQCQSATTMMHKFSATSQDTSPRRNTRRQCSDDCLTLQAGCSEVTRDQNGSDANWLEEISQDVLKKLHAFYQFGRPHTMFGTALTAALCTTSDPYYLSFEWMYLALKYV